nr:NADH dehydrogenase subunit 6 [Borysthenes sp. 2 WQW-2023a]
MKILILSMNMMSMSTPFLKHPISLGSMLFLQSVFTSLMMIMLNKNSWMPMTLIITFSGGIMIMFIYMSSIASNEKFKPSSKWMLLLMTTTLLTMKLMMTDKINLFFNKWMENSNHIQYNEEMKTMFSMLSMNKNTSILLILTVMMTMVVISSIISTFEGPLKKT